jgi:hypothetical protein
MKSRAQFVPGEGTLPFRRKRQEIRRSETSLVASDLLRTGSRVLAEKPERK